MERKPLSTLGISCEALTAGTVDTSCPETPFSNFMRPRIRNIESGPLCLVGVSSSQQLAMPGPVSRQEGNSPYQTCLSFASRIIL